MMYLHAYHTSHDQFASRVSITPIATLSRPLLLLSQSRTLAYAAPPALSFFPPPPSAPSPPPLSAFPQARRQDRRRKTAIILHHLSHEKQHSTSTVHSTQSAAPAAVLPPSAPSSRQASLPLCDLFGLWCSASRSTSVRGHHRKSKDQHPSRRVLPLSTFIFLLIFFFLRPILHHQHHHRIKLGKPKCIEINIRQIFVCQK